MSIDEGVKKLAKLSERQGYITYNDINEIFSDLSWSADELDEVYVKLRNLDINILDLHPNPDRNSRA